MPFVWTACWIDLFRCRLGRKWLGVGAIIPRGPENITGLRSSSWVGRKHLDTACLQVRCMNHCLARSIWSEKVSVQTNKCEARGPVYSKFEWSCFTDYVRASQSRRRKWQRFPCSKLSRIQDCVRVELTKLWVEWRQPTFCGSIHFLFMAGQKWITRIL